MADAAQTDVTRNADDAAEKAYAAAAEKVVAKPVAAKADDVKPVAAPAVAKVEAPAPVAAKPVVAKPAPQPVVTKPVVAKPVVAKPVVAKKVPAKAAAAAPAKRKYVRKAVKPVVAAKAKPVAPKTAKAKPAARKPVAKPAAKITTKPTTLISKLKETKMATTTKKTADDFTAKVQDTVKDVQARAKTAFEKSQALLGDAGEFTKGNLEAIVESGKILATGVQAMGKTYVAEVKTTLETVSADVKDLRAAATSPSEFVKLQSSLMRKYFDNAVAYNSKSAEAALKLANDAFQPISSRVSLAVEKVKKAA